MKVLVHDNIKIYGVRQDAKSDTENVQDSTILLGFGEVRFFNADEEVENSTETKTSKKKS